MTDLEARLYEALEGLLKEFHLEHGYTDATQQTALRKAKIVLLECRDIQKHEGR